jgi:MFS family permease
MIAVGMGADRFNKRVMISLSYGLPGLAVLFLFRLEASVPLFLFAILFGACGAGRAAIWPLVVNDCFGTRAYAAVMGFLYIFSTVGIIVGPPIAGYIFDTTQSYTWVFIISMIGFAVAGISMAVGAKQRQADG